MSEIILEAILTCPNCGTPHQETMPADAWQFMFTCTSCGETSTPKDGDCCVFCSHADRHCAEKQREAIARDGWLTAA